MPDRRHAHALHALGALGTAAHRPDNRAFAPASWHNIRSATKLDPLRDYITAGRSYGLGRFTKRTLGEYYPVLLDPKRRTLHAIWTQPVAEADEPHSRIFHAAARL